MTTCYVETLSLDHFLDTPLRELPAALGFRLHRDASGVELQIGQWTLIVDGRSQSREPKLDVRKVNLAPSVVLWQLVPFGVGHSSS